MHISKKIISIVLVVIMITSMIPNVFASQLVSTDTWSKKGIDGLVEGGDASNNYGWSSAEFQQDDGDYLWVAVNRDFVERLTLYNMGGGDDIGEMAMSSLVKEFLGSDSGGTSRLEYDRFDEESLAALEEQAAGIYRLKLADPTAKFELVWKDNTCAGYRKMYIDPNDPDHLYAFTGVSNNINGTRMHYIYRFDKDFEFGDIPDVIFALSVTDMDLMMNRIVYDGEQLLRGCTVLGGTVYVGTMASELYRTTTPLKDLESLGVPGDIISKADTLANGWELVTLNQFYDEIDISKSYFAGMPDAVIQRIFPDYIPGSGVIQMAPMIWDVKAYDGKLYIFGIGMGGGSMFEYTPAPDNTASGTCIPIMGGQAAAKYESGFGYSGYATFCGFTYQDEFYVASMISPTTPFMMFAESIVGMTDENLTTEYKLKGLLDAFSSITPSIIFHLEEDGSLSIVVGDDNTYYEKDGTPLERYSNDAGVAQERSGFFQGSTDLNTSMNMYVWWMSGNYEGDTLYASTYDMFFAMTMIRDLIKDTLLDALESLDIGVVNQLIKLIEKFSETQNVLTHKELPSFSEALRGLLSNILSRSSLPKDIPMLRSSPLPIEVPTSENTVEDQVIEAFADFDLGNNALGALTDVMELIVEEVPAEDSMNRVMVSSPYLSSYIPPTIPENYINQLDGKCDLLTILFLSTLYLTNATDDGGFDLYKSTDSGINWEPITISGFETDAYGGRIIVPTSYGTYVCTADPMTGCSVWRIEDLEKGLVANTPHSVTNIAEDPYNRRSPDYTEFTVLSMSDNPRHTIRDLLPLVITDDSKYVRFEIVHSKTVYGTVEDIFTDVTVYNKGHFAFTDTDSYSIPHAYTLYTVRMIPLKPTDADGVYVNVTFCQGRMKTTKTIHVTNLYKTDLSINVTPDPISCEVGDTVTYTIEVTNSSLHFDVNNVSVDTVFDSTELNVISSTIPAGSFKVNAGETKTFTVTCETLKAGEVLFTAEISYNDPVYIDERTDNNTATATVQVTDPEDPIVDPEPEDPTIDPTLLYYIINSSINSTFSAYAVKIEDMTDGTVKSSHKEANAGQKVSFTVSADKGFELKSISVVDYTRSEVKTSTRGNGVYTITMPASQVYVSAVFEKIVDETEIADEPEAEPVVEDVVDDVCDGGENCPSSHLTDVDPTMWYHEAIDYVIENSIFTGTSDTEFSPDETMNRAMVAQILYNIAGRPEVDLSTNVFTDVAEDDWFANAVIWATEAGWLLGYGDDTFGPLDSITREQFAVILYRYQGSPELSGSEVEEILSAYADSADVSSWAATAMAWALSNDLLPLHDGAIDPAAAATRAEIAQTFLNLDSIVEN